MRLDPDDKARLRDIRRFAREAKSFVAGMKEGEFLKDAKTQRALERALEIIGEAAKNLGPESRQAFPEVPFSRMVGLRNLLAHGYEAVLADRLWETAKKDIPQLLHALDTGPDFS